MDSDKRPQPFPPAVEPDEDDDERPRSTLPDAVVEKEARQAIEEIEEEIEEEHPAKPRPAPHVARGPQKSFVDKAWDTQYKVENRLKRIGHGRYGRVVKMARKPEPEEFHKASQITGIGILVVGALGFFIFLIMRGIMHLLRVT